ncbi:M24 family metallopeptidase [Clostridium polynesiense]|uniref:M24 family metallopeptidase n=1 Tax=Clostridium polynesiense TaxID=1325933 RepID=UPI000ABE9F90|nr:Xaa-Pro peptidase family protein [Clostridium polynesiense]
MIEKVEKIASKLKAFGIDAIVLHSAENRRYITGLKTSSGAVLITAEGKCACITDFRYIEVLSKKAYDNICSVYEVPQGMEDEFIGELLKRYHCKSVYIEHFRISAQHYNILKSTWKAELVESNGMIESMRAIKDARELEYIRVSQQIAEHSLDQTFKDVQVGMTEKEVEALLTWNLLKNGSENGIFGIVVASGPNSSMPHALPSGRRIDKGDFLLIDFGAIYNGYYSDITRTAAVGYATEEMKKVYDVVHKANCEAIAALGKGCCGSEMDRAARDIITQSGYGEYFGHGLGHGVGLEIHESPRLSKGSKEIIQAGNVITVEPGIYLPGKFGVRIEDLIYIGEDGIENLTSMTKELTII